MDKYAAIEELYKKRSDLNLKIVALEDQVVKSDNTFEKYKMLDQLSRLYYESFELQDDIRTILDIPIKKPSIWNRLTHKK